MRFDVTIQKRYWRKPQEWTNLTQQQVDVIFDENTDGGTVFTEVEKVREDDSIRG